VISQDGTVFLISVKAVINGDKICHGCRPAELSGSTRDLLGTKAEENDRSPHQSGRDAEVEQLVHYDAVEADSSKQAYRYDRADTIQANGVAELQECRDRRMGYTLIVDVRVQIPETRGGRRGRSHRPSYQVEGVVSTADVKSEGPNTNGVHE